MLNLAEGKYRKLATKKRRKKYSFCMCLCQSHPRREIAEQTVDEDENAEPNLVCLTDSNKVLF